MINITQVLFPIPASASFFRKYIRENWPILLGVSKANDWLIKKYLKKFKEVILRLILLNNNFKAKDPMNKPTKYVIIIGLFGRNSLPLIQDE